jgi:hypothetical protein
MSSVSLPILNPTVTIQLNRESTRMKAIERQAANQPIHESPKGGCFSFCEAPSASSEN